MITEMVGAGAADQAALAALEVLAAAVVGAAAVCGARRFPVALQASERHDTRPAAAAQGVVAGVGLQRS